jgi:Na+-translocating ferredoxin:NAD+ oxidoreductase RnfD subunit
MVDSSMTEKSPWQDLVRFFRRPKGLLILLLAVLALVAGFHEGLAAVAPVMAAAMVTAAVIDAPILRYRKSAWEFPDGALLTGMIIGMILSASTPWYVAAVASAIGVLSKYVFRSRSANVFNPAALALVVVYYVFDAAEDWWGALPNLSPFALVLLIATGLFITDRVNKLPLLFSFLGLYFLLFTLTTFVSSMPSEETGSTPANATWLSAMFSTGRLAEIFRAPDLHMVLFFALFILTDPPTSPPRTREQIIYGVMTAVATYAFFQLVGAVYFLLAGLTLANVWEAWRRQQAHSKRQRYLEHQKYCQAHA